MTGKFRKLFSKRSLLSSQKLLRRRRTVIATKLAGGILLFAGFIWSVAYTSSAPQLTIQNIVVAGNSVVPTEGVIQVADSTLSGKYLGLFSRANFLWYPKKDIVTNLLSTYSWLDTVSIKKINLTTLEIDIKERKPIAVWCGASRANAQSCKLMDADGYTFAPAPDFDGPAYLRLYGPLTSANSRGAKFFSQKGLEHIMNFTKGLTELDLKPSVVEVSLTSAQEEYAVVLQGGTRIDVHVDDPVLAVLDNLHSLFLQKLFTDSSKQNFTNLVSVDMRFGNKIFYKFKDAVPSATTTTGTSSKI